MNKKGQFGGIGEIFLGLATVTIVLTIMFLIISKGETQLANDVDSLTVNNETFTFVNATSTLLAVDCIPGTISCNSLRNGTESIDAGGNWSCSGRNITVNNYDRVGFASQLNVTYSCQPASIGYNSSITLQRTGNDTAGFMPLVALVAVGLVLLSLVQMFKR